MGDPVVDKYKAIVMKNAIIKIWTIQGTIGKNNVDVAALTALKEIIKKKRRVCTKD